MPVNEPNTTTDPAATPPADATPATPPAIDPIQYVPRADYDALRAQVAHMEGAVQTLLAGRQAVAAPPPPPTVSDDDLVAMLESGDARQILKANRILNEQALRPVVGEFQSFRAATIHTAETLGRDVIEARGLMPYYKDPAIKREIDAFMETLPPEARANRESWILAHNYVTAQPQHMERIVTQRVEEEMRKRAGAATPTAEAGATPGRGAAGTPGAPSVTELLGEGAAQALRAQGKTPDEFARRLGYKSWTDYAAVIQSEQSANAGEELQ